MKRKTIKKPTSNISLLWKISDKIWNVFKLNKSNNKEVKLKNSKLEHIQWNKIENQVINNYTIVKSEKKHGNIKKFRNDIRNNKIIILDSENNFPEKELLIKYGFKNIKIVSTISQLKKQQDVWAIIYRYRLKKYYQQIEKQVFTTWIFGIPKLENKIEMVEKYKAEEDLEELVNYVSKLNIPLFVYSYPDRVENEDWNILTSYYFVVFANFPLMLINHLKNILIIKEKL